MASVSDLPPIRIDDAGRVMAGVDIELRPSHRHWRRQRCWWKAWSLDQRRALSGWHLTPQLALTVAIRHY